MKRITIAKVKKAVKNNNIPLTNKSYFEYDEENNISCACPISQIGYSYNPNLPYKELKKQWGTQIFDDYNHDSIADCYKDYLIDDLGYNEDYISGFIDGVDDNPLDVCFNTNNNYKTGYDDGQLIGKHFESEFE